MLTKYEIEETTKITQSYDLTPEEWTDKITGGGINITPTGITITGAEIMHHITAPGHTIQVNDMDYTEYLTTGELTTYTTNDHYTTYDLQRGYSELLNYIPEDTQGFIPF